MASFDDSVRNVRLVGGLILLLIGVAAGWRARRMLRGSETWPTVDGRILYGHAKNLSDGVSALWYAEMSYSFTTLQGDYYAGTFDHRTGNEEEADEYARRMKDARVSVRYKPGNPEISVATVIGPANADASVAKET
jgi:hypothetical protein